MIGVHKKYNDCSVGRGRFDANHSSSLCRALTKGDYMGDDLHIAVACLFDASRQLLEAIEKKADPKEVSGLADYCKRASDQVGKEIELAKTTGVRL